MYKLKLEFLNPQTGDSETMVVQFEPATLTQALWNSAFPGVKAKVDGLVQMSTPKEPVKW